MPSRDKNPVRAGQNDMTIRVDPPSIHRRVEDLRQRYEGRAGLALLRPIIEDEFPDQVALACSFGCLLYTSPSPRDLSTSRMPSSA